jgi:ATP-dependent DNA ligase
MNKKTFPTFVPPMMAESAKAPFDSPDWIFEIKLDGYRAITVFDAAGKSHLWSRNGLALEAKFPAVAQAISKLNLRSTILDGEVVAVNQRERDGGHHRQAQRQRLPSRQANLGLAQDQGAPPTGVCGRRVYCSEGKQKALRPRRTRCVHER